MTPPAVAAAVRRLADTVLYEGYVLYPYRASAGKNRVRFPWGVLMPPAAVVTDPSERSTHDVAVLLDGDAASVEVTVRFLQVQRRHVEDDAGHRVDRLDAGATTYLPWDEAREREVCLEVPLDGGLDVVVRIEGGRETEEVPGGRLVRERAPAWLRVEGWAEQPVGPYPVRVVRLRLSNTTEVAGVPPDSREGWLRHALVAAHLLVATQRGRFLSLIDPPEWARPLAERVAADRQGLFPVLADPDDRVLLCSPIILYDHVEVAPESATDFFDALEIDELLSLRTATLTEQERREVRGTDPRAAALLDEVDAMPAELWQRLHGAVRSLDGGTPAGPGVRRSSTADVPWWDPAAEEAVDLDARVVVDGREVGPGSRVLLRPGARRADAQDLFLAGRSATVAMVLDDVDGGRHLAVTVDDDPGADLQARHGRYLYFAPDEVELLDREDPGEQAEAEAAP